MILKETLFTYDLIHYMGKHNITIGGLGEGNLKTFAQLSYPIQIHRQVITYIISCKPENMEKLFLLCCE